MIQQFRIFGCRKGIVDPRAFRTYSLNLRSHKMEKNTAPAVYIILMIVIIMAVDFLFLRHRFRERLITNIAIVAAFAVFYLVFLRRP